jgi:hypothetical protein
MPKLPKNKRYVVWDGSVETDYVEDPIWHDCAITYDGGLISVQKIRHWVLHKNIVPTVFFACKGGHESYEMEGVGGVFTHCLARVIEHDPNVTYRDAVRLINEAIKLKGVKQICEIVCREDVLDMAVNNCSKIDDAVHMVMFFDMCRTKP